MSNASSPTSVRFSKAVADALGRAKKKTKLPQSKLIEMSVERGLPVLLSALGIAQKGNQPKLSSAK